MHIYRLHVTLQFRVTSDALYFVVFWPFSWCSYKVPGQFVGVRLDNGGDGGVAGCLVAVTMEPTSVRQSDGKIQVLVTEEATFRLKGAVTQTRSSVRCLKRWWWCVFRCYGKLLHAVPWCHYRIVAVDIFCGLCGGRSWLVLWNADLF